MPDLLFEGKRIHWETHGEGRPLLFLHEWNSSSALFRDHALDRYAGQHTVILIDLPGFGRSEALDTLSMEGLTRLLEKLLDCLGHRSTLVLGFCLGAILALDFALRRPSRVDRLVLVDVLVRFPPLMKAPFVPAIGPAFLHFFTRTTLGSGLAAWFLSHSDAFGSGLARQFDQVRLAVSYAYLRMMRRYSATDHLSRAERLKAPVLCLASGTGPLPFRRCAEDLACRVPEGRVTVIQGGRHYAIVSAPQRVSPAVLAFFGETEPRAGIESSASFED